MPDAFIQFVVSYNGLLLIKLKLMKRKTIFVLYNVHQIMKI
jgi:hypothetical protein